MILIIAAKHKFEEHLLVATFAKRFLISMAKAFSFFCVVFTKVSTIISCAPEHVVLQKGLNIYQIFNLLNKNIQNKFQEIFLSTEWITLKSFIRKNRLTNIAPKHCFGVTLADCEQIIMMISCKWRLDDWMTLFFVGVKQIWNNFCVTS